MTPKPYRPAGSMHPIPAVLDLIARGATTLSRGDVEPVMSDLVLAWRHGDRTLSTDYARDGARPVAKVLTWLEHQDGDTWDERWHNSGADDLGRDWHSLTGSRGRIEVVEMNYAINALLVTRMIKPSHEFLRSMVRRRLPDDWVLYHDRDTFTRLLDELSNVKAQPTRRLVQRLCVEVCICSGKTLETLTSDDVVAMHRWLKARKSSENMRAAWHYLKKAGALVDEPDELIQALVTQREPLVELIDRHQVQPRPVRDAFVAYLRERQAMGADYATLRWTGNALGRSFWATIQREFPDQRDLKLTPAQANVWIQHISSRPDGTPRGEAAALIGAVRNFYVEVAALAHDDPGLWAEHAHPWPISGKAVSQRFRKSRAQLTARMHERTRALSPELPILVASTATNHRYWSSMLKAATTVDRGEEFTVGDEIWTRRPPAKREYRSATVEVLSPEGKRYDLTGQEERAFWTWAVIEVLRHTGLRCGEMLSLTHLSLQPFRKPTGEVIPLLQVAPSKTDRERVIPIAPELVSVLGQIVARNTVNGGIPLVRRHSAHKKTFSAPMPFLFQRRFANGRHQMIETSTVRVWLADACRRAELRYSDGSQATFTPHDFRRLFATEAMRYGMPIHIIAELLGHADLNTTRGYGAVYPEEVFREYESHIARRRAERPSTEYRQPTPGELQEFAEHFGRRRVELGDCVRPYATGCTHEHACIRCEFLQVVPEAGQRLPIIEADLNRRLDEARTNQWLGDLEQLRITIDRLHDKQTALGQRPPDLSLPMVQPVADVTGISTVPTEVPGKA